MNAFPRNTTNQTGSDYAGGSQTVWPLVEETDLNNDCSMLNLCLFTPDTYGSGAIWSNNRIDINQINTLELNAPRRSSGTVIDTRSRDTASKVYVWIRNDHANNAEVPQLHNRVSLWNALVRGSIKREARVLCDNALALALADLHEVGDEAREEGFPQPSRKAWQNANRLLRRMYAMFPQRFEVYPTQDGDITLGAYGGTETSVLLLCELEGSAVCSVYIRGDYRQKRYATADELPDEFLIKALYDLSKT